LTRRTLVVSCILTLCLVTGSCKKLETGNPGMLGPLAFEPAKSPNAIPAEYGNLTGVTQNPSSPGWIGLWFQKPDGTVTAVFVNVEKGKMFERILTIPRR
jgi:hypothetical protein